MSQYLSWLKIDRAETYSIWDIEKNVGFFDTENGKKIIISGFRSVGTV